MTAKAAGTKAESGSLLEQPGTEPFRFDLRWGLICLAALSLARILLSINLPLFGDEAFYWQEGRYPALAYSDLPPMTAWLTRAGSELFGLSYIGVRGVFLLCGFALPLVVVGLARLTGAGRHHSLWAGALSLALPVQGITAPFALPEAIINLLWLSAAALTALLLTGRSRWWLWPALGLVLAGGLLTHYRFAPLLMGLAGLLLFHPPARRCLVHPGPWTAALMAALALWPQWQFNAAEDFAALNFQFVDRHPWQFDLAGLKLPLLDLLLLTPVLGWLLLVSVKALLGRRQHSAAAVLLWLGAVPVLIYWCLSPLVDTQRVSFHWTLGGWLTLCAGIPLALQQLAARYQPNTLRWALLLALVPGLALSTAALGYWQLAALAPQQRPPSADVVPDNLLGWPQIADRMGQLSRRYPRADLVADNFMLAVELSFELQRQVDSLDHPLNHKHGRARQLMIWDRIYHRQPGQSALLAVEITALGLKQRVAWMQQLCGLLGQGRILEEVSLFGGRKRVLLMLLEADATAAPGCDQPAFSYLDEPGPGSVHVGRLALRGWALEAFQGVASVDVMLDGEFFQPGHYGDPRPGVAGYFGLATTPDHPNIGFSADLDLTGLPAGRYILQLRIHERDGSTRLTDPRWIELATDGP